MKPHKYKAGAVQNAGDVISDLFLLVFAVTGIIIFASVINQDRISSVNAEKSLYINHIFSNPNCLAYNLDGIVMPYYVNYNNIEDESDLRGCLVLYPYVSPSSSVEPQDEPAGQYNTFAMKITISPMTVMGKIQKKVVYYNKEEYEKWQLFLPSSPTQLEHSSLRGFRSIRMITLVYEGKEIPGFAIIESIFPT